MSSLGTSYRTSIPALATVVTSDALGAVGAAHPSKVSEMLIGYATRNLRSGLTVRRHIIDVVGLGGAPDARVELTRVADNAPPTVTSSHQRARVFFAKGTCDGDVLNSLRNSDGPVRGSPGYVRDSHRLDAVVERTAKLRRPNVELSNYQLTVPLGFGPENVGSERPYRPVAQSQMRRVYDLVGDAGYRQRCEDAIDLGDYTHHDPDLLHPRFLEYVHERSTDVDQDTHVAVSEAMAVMAKHWVSKGLAVKARPLSDAVPEVFGTEITAGSQGEYRALGATSRNDERLVLTLCDSLLRYGEAARQVVRAGRVPDFVNTTQQPSGMFGKNERRAAKYKDGRRVEPVPRCIFNVSPVDWALAKFLHGHISEFLSEHDTLHGPGYGPNRGRSWKLLRVLDRAFGASTTAEHNVIMSDIEKWDANMSEYLLGRAFDLLESAVDCSGLNEYNKAARASMVSVARRHLMEKLVEHPSGYFVHMYGCMPSGSYYTSLLNTVGNNLLVISLVIRRLMTEKGLTPRVARARVQAHVDGNLLSYGDNQIVGEELFIAVGLEYDANLHAEHLKRFGMKLKVDETEVTRKAGRARFCSRGCVTTPAGKLLMRTHTSMLTKVAGTPELEPMTYKLWLRATAIDHMGADPIVYNFLKHLDSMVQAPQGTVSIKSRQVRDVLDNLCQKFVGDTSEESMAIALGVLERGFPTRAALLSLHTRLEKGAKDKRLGMALFFDDGKTGFDLTPAAQWALDQTEESWLEYLRKTDQMGLLVD
ncbi:RNA-dependent RNA polymerase [Penicillium digitatum polymycoviruses 1]|uniref:RNA-dependent RNA polymerase n=1 Tax=Penicillium digitatum polymycoviruses 1 TaxID=2164101 RepID=A0A2R4SUG6_9VIRU|nr:RNA-dependent RNA polymerase [Penicillium digitatum polymycoviruses 1]AVZ65983.1 RNA-dependent RNA polymerase [Penicillium digitatum polymycoviruses 1]